MRLLILPGLALFLQSCVGRPDPLVVEKAVLRPAPLIVDMSAEATQKNTQQSITAKRNDPKRYAVRIVLTPMVSPVNTRVATYEDGNLVFARGDDIISNVELNQSQSQRLHRILESFDEDAWSGFYKCHGLFDGDLVGCQVERGDEVLKFRGINGAPQGFSGLLAEIGSISRKDLLPDWWATLERDSRQYESWDSSMRHLVE